MRSLNLQLGLNSFWQGREGGERGLRSARRVLAPLRHGLEPREQGRHRSPGSLRGRGASGAPSPVGSIPGTGNQEPTPGRCRSHHSSSALRPRPRRQHPTYRPVEPPLLVHGQVEAGVHRPDGHDADTHRPDLDDACGTAKRRSEAGDLPQGPFPSATAVPTECHQRGTALPSLAGRTDRQTRGQRDGGRDGGMPSPQRDSGEQGLQPESGAGGGKP